MRWIRGGVSTAVLYPTNGLSVGWIREPDVAVAYSKAWNDFVSEEFQKVSPRLKAVALVPFQDVPEAVKELRRAVKELKLPGLMLPAVGLRLPLGTRASGRFTKKRRGSTAWSAFTPRCAARIILPPTCSINLSKCILCLIPSPR